MFGFSRVVLRWDQGKKQGKLGVTAHMLSVWADSCKVGWGSEFRRRVWSGQCLYNATCLLVAGAGRMTGVGACGGEMGVEQEPEPASLELLWGTLAMVGAGGRLAGAPGGRTASGLGWAWEHVRAHSRPSAGQGLGAREHRAGVALLGCRRRGQASSPRCG